MEIKLNKIDEAKLYELIDQKEKNIYCAELLNDLINNSLSFKDEEIITPLDLVEPYLDEEDLIDLKDNLNNPIKELDISKYLNNPFNKLNIKETKFKDYKLEYKEIQSKEIFISDEIKISKNKAYLENSQLGYFLKPYRYLNLSKNNVTWMSLIPNEINTMEIDLNTMHGDILVLGLGLGYMSYSLALKKDVTSITIIEKDPNIINIFLKCIAPSINKEILDKIKIIKHDALIYLNKEDLSKFNYVYVDLYHNVNDGLDLYLKIKKIESLNKGTKFLYWLNLSFLSLIRRILLTLFIEVYEGSTSQDYIKVEYDTDKLLNKLYFKLIDLKISSIEDIYKFIEDENINELIKSINY